MIVAAAFVPSTPLLVPAVASGAAAELDDLRRACTAALSAACAAAPEQVVVVGAGRHDAVHVTGTGTFRGFGVDLDVPLDPAHPHASELPLALSVGAWLLAQVGWPGDRRALELDPAGDPRSAGADLALASTRRTALLVVADGSAARTEKAPAGHHPGSAAFDAAVAAALRSGDPATLASIDRALASEVSSGGWPAWAAAAAALDQAEYDAELLAEDAPYGVGYLVATWMRR